MKFEKFFENNLNNNIDMYVDMDGVLAEYDIGNFDYNTIRPITTIINRIKKISLYKNVRIKVLSICKTNQIVAEKYEWFKYNCDFISEEQLIFISKEKEEFLKFSSKELKFNYLKDNLNKENITVVVDDDNEILSYIKKSGLDVILFQDSSLVD